MLNTQKTNQLGLDMTISVHFELRHRWQKKKQFSMSNNDTVTGENWKLRNNTVVD